MHCSLPLYDTNRAQQLTMLGSNIGRREFVGTMLFLVLLTTLVSIFYPRAIMWLYTPTTPPTQGKGLFFVNDTESSYRLKLFLEQFHVRSAVLNAELPLNSRLHILQVREPEGFVLWCCGVWCATVNQHNVDVNIGGARGKRLPNE